MPSVQRAHDTFQRDGVTVVTISLDGEGLRAVKPVIDQGRHTFMALIDQDMQVARAFGVRGVPMTYVVDANGMIRVRGFGAVDLDGRAMRDYLRRVAAS